MNCKYFNIPITLTEFLSASSFSPASMLNIPFQPLKPLWQAAQDGISLDLYGLT